MRLQRVGHQRYRLVGGPAAGALIERSANPEALPCYRWSVVEGVRPGEPAGWTLRGLAAACERAAGRTAIRELPPLPATRMEALAGDVEAEEE